LQIIKKQGKESNFICDLKEIEKKSPFWEIRRTKKFEALQQKVVKRVRKL
jgi:hypothetical protein